MTTVRTTASITPGTPPRTPNAGETTRDLDAVRAAHATRRAGMFWEAANRACKHYEVLQERRADISVWFLTPRGDRIVSQYQRAGHATQNPATRAPGESGGKRPGGAWVIRQPGSRHTTHATSRGETYGPRPATNPAHHALIRARHFRRARMNMSTQRWPTTDAFTGESLSEMDRCLAWHHRDDAYEAAFQRTLGLEPWL